MAESERDYNYSLIVVDNYHLGDPDETGEYETGPFINCCAAVQHARGLIDAFASSSWPISPLNHRRKSAIASQAV